MTQARDIASDLGLRLGAHDRNRTRAISLGIQPIEASDRADLDSRHTASDRHPGADQVVAAARKASAETAAG
jgi:hypothetical protein